MDLLDRLLGHDQWTTSRLLEMSGSLTDAQLDQPFDIGHRTLRATFDHMISAVDFWTTAMLGRPEPMHEYENGTPQSLEALRAWHERAYAAFSSLARQLQAEQRLDEIYRDYYDYPQSIGATIIQVALHDQQHRSEVLHILQRLGLTDLPDGDAQEWEHLTGRIPSPDA
ncbi:MAG TPA: DinB family protein [Thermomicrobiales bacterium]|nr:DinB family protein [Thermomicrobiales bacterium]